MASPKNYERQKDAERRTRPFVWRHRSGHPQINVTEYAGSKGNYRISVPGHPPDYRQATLGFADSKEDARSMAVDWMRDNPKGGRYQVSRR